MSSDRHPPQAALTFVVSRWCLGSRSMAQAKRKDRKAGIAARIGAILKDQLAGLQARHAAIGDVRGLGLMIGVEFVTSDASRAPDPQRRDRVMRKCFESGLLLLSCGESTLRFCPPLIVTAEEVKRAVAIFESAVASP